MEMRCTIMTQQENGFGNDFVVLTDEEGNEFELEHLDTLEKNGETYFAFIRAQIDLEDEGELIILKTVLDDDGQEALITVDDDDEYDEIFELFSERLEDYYEEEEQADQE